jgi:hypothetical protein
MAGLREVRTISQRGVRRADARVPNRPRDPDVEAASNRETGMSTSKTTTDHKVIRKWAEQRGGRPSVVKATEGKDHSGILRFDFRDPDDKLDDVSWDDFFKTFEDRELALLYQEKTADGKTSRFFKFVHRSEAG